MMYGVMLAAGLSTRMGEEKLLLPLGDQLVIEASIEAASQVCDHLLVVVKRQLYQAVPLPEGVIEIVNEHPEDGQSSSIRVAIEWIEHNEPTCDGVLFFLADKPRLDISGAVRIRERAERSRSAIIAGRCLGAIGHPVAFGADWFEELVSMRGDEGGRQIIRRHPEVVEYLEVADSSAADIDTCNDYLDMVFGWRNIVVVRGAGDIATGTIHRLHQAGFCVIATDIEQPTVIRRTVSFAQAIMDGSATVEGVVAKRCESMQEIAAVLREGCVPVVVDPRATWVTQLRPAVVVDGILAKRNVGTTKDMAPVVVALGPGFVAGIDCDAVVETKRGHYLGQVIYEGAALPNTGVPGMIGGYASERVVHASASGIIALRRDIGDHVEVGEPIACIGNETVKSPLTGVLRGMIAEGTVVEQGLKIADIDPRDEPSYCFSVSDKARSVAGGVLEAVMHLQATKPGIVSRYKGSIQASI